MKDEKIHLTKWEGHYKLFFLKKTFVLHFKNILKNTCTLKYSHKTSNKFLMYYTSIFEKI